MTNEETNLTGSSVGGVKGGVCLSCVKKSNDRAFRTGWSVVKGKVPTYEETGAFDGPWDEEEKQTPQERLTLCDECSNAVYDAQHQLGLDPWEDHDFESIAATVGGMLPDHLCENREEAEEWALQGLKCLCACNRR